MRQKSTDAQARRRKNAVWGAAISTLFQCLSALLLLWLRSGLEPGGFLPKLLLVLAVLDLGSVIPVWISLRERLREIEGGEEDAAAQY